MWAECGQIVGTRGTPVSPEVRRPVVAQLSAAGMSTRAIAPVVGVGQANVARDLQVVQSAPPAPKEIPSPLPASDTITGMENRGPSW